jgi:dTDP-4-dehydrorhamnose 3,5-epimerase
MSQQMKWSDTPLEGLRLVRRSSSGDSRGWFEKVFCQQTFREHGLDFTIQQVNRSFTEKAGSIRGLHYQNPPYHETKAVSCLRGRVLDLAVDLRQGSPTFLHWHGVELSPENGLTYLIPRGFAHGFQALEDGTELLYLHDQSYMPSAEGGIRFDDPRLALAFPLPVGEISERDRSWKWLTQDFAGLPC